MLVTQSWFKFDRWLCFNVVYFIVGSVTGESCAKEGGKCVPRYSDCEEKITFFEGGDCSINEKCCWLLHKVTNVILNTVYLNNKLNYYFFSLLFN